jgi:hypothetical protein
MTSFLAHLYAIRMHLDALIIAAELEAGIAEKDPGAFRDPRTCPKCGAPADLQTDQSTLDGTKRLRCSACGEEREL